MGPGDLRGAASRVGPKAPRRGKPRSCVWWFLLGSMLGAFGVGLYWTMHSPDRPPPPVAAALPAAERPAPPKPSFQFPNILRDTEVEIGGGKPPPPPAPRPEPPPKPPALPAEPSPDGTGAQTRVQPAVKPGPKAGEAPPKAQEKPATPGTYVLQMGSFKSPGDAEAMKAKLAMQGISSRVQAATIKDGQVWHRVVTGPFQSKESMESARAQLKRQGRDSFPVKVR